MKLDPELLASIQNDIPSDEDILRRLLSLDDFLRREGYHKLPSGRLIRVFEDKDIMQQLRTVHTTTLRFAELAGYESPFDGGGFIVKKKEQP